MGDHVHDDIDLKGDLGVREAEDGEAPSCQPLIPLLVVLAPDVLVAVYLHDQSSFVAEEIDDELSQRFLSPPFDAGLRTQEPPQTQLLLGRRAAQPPCVPRGVWLGRIPGHAGNLPCGRATINPPVSAPSAGVEPFSSAGRLAEGRLAGANRFPFPQGRVAERSEVGMGLPGELPTPPETAGLGEGVFWFPSLREGWPSVARSGWVSPVNQQHRSKPAKLTRETHPTSACGGGTPP